MLFLRAWTKSLRRHIHTSSSADSLRADMTAALWSVYCLTSESSDTSLSIVMDCNSSRYLFNCGEGTTRALLQRRKGFRKFKALFLTEINTDKSGGLLGMLMTMADANITKIDIAAPSGLHHLLASARYYAMRETLSVNTKEISDTPDSPIYGDENISVFAVPLFPDKNSDAPSRKRKELTLSLPPSPPSKRKRLDTPTENSSGTERTSTSQSEEHRLRIIQQMFGNASSTSNVVSQFQSQSGLVRRKSFSLFDKSLPRLIHDPLVVSYVVVGAQSRGKFDAVKAKEVGLTNGPIRAKLARGETVVTEDGRRITPDMVLGPAPKPEVFIFVDCPSPEHIPSLERSTIFRHYQKGGRYPAHCVIHLLGKDVFESPRYKTWLSLFDESTYHLFAGAHVTPDRICFTSTAYAQLRLSHLDKLMFSIPKCLPSQDFPHDSSTTLLRHGHHVSMKPKGPPLLPPANDGIDLFHPAVEGGATDEITNFLKPKTVAAYQQAQTLIQNNKGQRKPRAGDDVTVIPLGTSSAMPSKYRNVSSLLIQFAKSQCVLLDCGEGTYGQLHRQFGINTPSILRNLDCIFISHVHGDHHMGLSKLLSKRRKLDPPCISPVYLIANQATVEYLREYSDLEDLGFEDSTSGVRIIPAERIQGNWDRESNSVEIHSSWQDLKARLNLSCLKSVSVPHRGRCFGIVIRHEEGWSIVYSGDTKPSESLIRAGQDATLLIHEATLGDDQKEMAEAKGHSTIGQAIEVGKRMRAQNILLTHFSNRFPKTPQLVTEFDPTSPTVAVAFDNSPMRIGDMWKLSYYLPAIEQSFLDSEDPVDEMPENDIKLEL